MAGSNALLPISHPLYAEIVQFLYYEAEILDARRFSEWLDLMAEDVTYRVPLRDDAKRELGTSATRLDWFDDDLNSLKLRVARLATDAYAESPASQTRHMITNIRVRATSIPSEFEVASNLLVHRNRGRRNPADVFCGERQDLLRNTSTGWRLARRTVVLDQNVIGTGSLGIFL
jgi:3-phenylpropionate/cinnamic acid dioxygenase small subunit